MKPGINLMIAMIACLAIQASAQPQWLNSYGDVNGNYITSADVDASGNSFMVVTFWDSLQVGDIHVTGNINTSYCIIKVDPTGNVEWAKAEVTNGSFYM